MGEFRKLCMVVVYIIFFVVLCEAQWGQDPPQSFSGYVNEREGDRERKRERVRFVLVLIFFCVFFFVCRSSPEPSTLDLVASYWSDGSAFRSLNGAVFTGVLCFVQTTTHSLLPHQCRTRTTTQHSATSNKRTHTMCR